MKWERIEKPIVTATKYKCPRCASLQELATAFCPDCGQKLDGVNTSGICPKCGESLAKLLDGTIVCLKCGGKYEA